MNILNKVQESYINSIGYDTIYLEQPVPDIIDFNWKNLLDKPPMNTDDVTIRELKTISDKSHSRTSEDIALIYTVDENLDEPFEILLKQYNLIYPQNYINNFYKIIKPVLLNTKGFWNRARPYQLAKFYDIDIDIIETNTHHTPSYPSGHTVYASLVSFILKDMYSELNMKELDSIVKSVADARIAQGVHYPSDNEASLIFSQKIFNNLNPKLRNTNYE